MQQDNNDIQTLFHLKTVYALTSSSASLLWASYILTALSTLLLLISTLHMLLIIVLMATILQHYLFIRVQFDRQLLQQLIQNQIPQNQVAQNRASQNSTIPDHESIASQTQYLDQALIDLGLIKQGKIQRPWSLRLIGILRLFKWQCGVFAITSMLFVTVLVIGIR